MRVVKKRSVPAICNGLWSGRGCDRQAPIRSRTWTRSCRPGGRAVSRVVW